MDLGHNCLQNNAIETKIDAFSGADMIAIPLPFVVALLLSILAVLLFIRREESSQLAFVFIGICAFTSIIVGLRWTTEIAIFKALLPISASFIPVVAWYCFATAHHKKRWYLLHGVFPVIVIAGSLTYPFWRPPLDPILMLLYVGYGIALIKASLDRNKIPERVRLSDVDKALKAEGYAGGMLLISAVIDGAIGVDFAFYQGAHAVYILTLGHFIMLPILAGAVVVMSLSVVPKQQEELAEEAKQQEAAKQTSPDKAKEISSPVLTDQEVKDIVAQIDALLTSKEVFLDPDLTLDRLSRKVGITSRQISIAINQVYGRNVSQVVNEYRIERAKQLLITTDKPITQIYFDSGFQTKSNFNREFSRVTQQTPSAFRRSQREGQSGLSKK